MFPQTIFALSGIVSAASLTERGALTLAQIAPRVPCMFLWIWVNLLVEDIANQRHESAIVEDGVNKPWRPLPSGRLSRREARNLMMAAMPAALALSLYLGAFQPSICLMAFVYMYNDLEGSSSDIWLRNVLNAAGLMCFSWGALSVLAKPEGWGPVKEGGGILAKTILSATDGKLTERAYVWILVTGAVITTTVHAQDMPDVEGDALRGRSTVPLKYGQAWARWSLAVMVLFWSAICPTFFPAMPWYAWVAPTAIGLTMSVLSILNRGLRCDELVWKLWCLWVTTIYLLPVFSGTEADAISGASAL